MYYADDGTHRLIVTVLDGAESERPDDHPLIRQAVKAELQAVDDYGGGCDGCGFPLVKGRTRCRSCGETPQAG